jgi:hypothetical protein
MSKKQSMSTKLRQYVKEFSLTVKKKYFSVFITQVSYFYIFVINQMADAYLTMVFFIAYKS